MSIEQKILNEIERYKEINYYIFEQGAPPPPPPPPAGAPPAAPPAGGVPPAPGAPPAPEAGAPAGPPEAVNTESDPDVEKVGDEADDKKSKEVDVTELVQSQKKVEEKQEEYFDNLFKHLEGLEGKLKTMDDILNKLNDLESKVEKYRVKTPEEKLELRSLDSGPYNQKLSQFFEDKQDEFEKTGKNEYVLTQDEVEDYSPIDVKKSFRDFGDEDEDESSFKEVRY